jgi:hypothetical protein
LLSWVEDVADVSVDVLLIPFGCDVDFVLDEHRDVGRWDVVAEDADELFQIVENLLAGTVLHWIRDPDDDFACGLTVVFDGEEVAVTGSALDEDTSTLRQGP